MMKKSKPTKTHEERESNNQHAKENELENGRFTENQAKNEEIPVDLNINDTGDQMFELKPDADDESFEVKYKETYDKYLRLSAEFDNYRKRTLKERMDLVKSAGEDVIKGFLPLLDDFERALLAIDNAKDLNAVKEGVLLIYQKTKDYLVQKGLKEIDAIHKDFDTDLHEAITQIPAPTPELAGKVVDVVQKGYFLNEKLIRFSKVVIGQ
jgi:molecular chaperone GrpE